MEVDLFRQPYRPADRDEVVRAYRRAIITRTERDELLLYTPENCQITIDIDRSEKDVFLLYVTLFNKSDTPLYTSLTEDALPRKKLRGLIVSSDDGEEPSSPSVAMAPIRGAMSLVYAFREGIAIPSGDSLVFEIRGDIQERSVYLSSLYSMPYTPGKRYQIQYRYAGLVSNTLSWIAP